MSKIGPKESGIFAFKADAAFPLNTQIAAIPVQCNDQGVLFVIPASSTGTPTDVIELNSDDEPQGLNGLVTASALYGFNGKSDAFDGWDRIRVAKIYKSVLATALGLTTVWTPAAGKSFRLMGYTISVAGTLAATGVNLLKLVDNVVGNIIAQHQATVTITTPTGDTQIGVDLGQGFLSAAPDNVLKINLGTAMATGGVAVNVWGTEE